MTANRILHKRSVKGTAVPTTSDLDEGELGINVRDGKMYTRKDSDGSSPEIVEIGQKGQKGAQGATGPQGDKGQKGQTGD